MSNYTRRKQYVEVLVSHEIDGSMVPRSVTLATGDYFKIDRVMNTKRLDSGQKGITITRFPVTIRGQDTSLFYDGSRWFVEMKEVRLQSGSGQNGH